MQTSDMKIRVPALEQCWIKIRAKENARSLNAEILDLIREAMKADPLQIFVHECKAPDGTFFTASIGRYGDDFYEGPDRGAAFVAARAKAKSLRLPLSCIRLETEDFTAA